MKLQEKCPNLNTFSTLARVSSSGFLKADGLKETAKRRELPKGTSHCKNSSLLTCIEGTAYDLQPLRKPRRYLSDHPLSGAPCTEEDPTFIIYCCRGTGTICSKGAAYRATLLRLGEKQNSDGIHRCLAFEFFVSEGKIQQRGFSQFKRLTKRTR